MPNFAGNNAGRGYRGSYSGGSRLPGNAPSASNGGAGILRQTVAMSEERPAFVQGPTLSSPSRLDSFNPNVAASNPYSDPRFVNRVARAKAGVLRNAQSAAGDYQRSTGLGAGTSGGAGQASLLRMLGSAQAENTADDMFLGERDFQTGLAAANKNREFASLQAGDGAELARLQMQQQQAQFENQFREGNYRYDFEYGTPDDNFNEFEQFVPTGGYDAPYVTRARRRGVLRGGLQ